MKKLNFKFALFFMLVVLFSNNSIAQLSFGMPQTSSSKLVLVAIASKEKNCRSGNAAYTTNNDIGMKYAQGSFNYSQQEANLKAELENTYGTEGVKIRMRSSRGKVVVIIRYKKNTSPYDCSVWEYAIGGGENYTDAMESAKRSYSIGGTYDVVANISNE